MKVKGTYCAVKFSKESNKLFDKILKDIELTKDFDDDFHCTLLYSKKYLPYFKTRKGDKKSSKINEIVKIKEFGHFDTPNGKNLHIVLNCLYCQKEFNRGKTQGASYDYDEYIPHITLVYDCKDFDIKDNSKLLEKYIGQPININEEYIEDLKFESD